jgi:hypothetical protein
MRRSLVPLVAAVTSVLSACADHVAPVESLETAPPGVSAVQAPPTEVADTFTAIGFCEFDIFVQASGKAKTVILPRGRAIALSPGLTWTLTNTDTGREKTFVVTGAFHFRTLENGDVELVVTGRNILGDPRGGLSLVIGRTRLIFDPGTGLFLPVGESRGRVIDLCEFLA